MSAKKSFQQGTVSGPFKTRRGTAFKIRWRVPGPGGTWQHRKETLYNVLGKKAARAILNQRIAASGEQTAEARNTTLRELVEQYWRPYLDRKGIKPSTRAGYESVLKLHIFPLLGEKTISEISTLDIEKLLQSKKGDNSERKGLSAQSVRNVIAVLQGIFSYAEENDLIERSPVRKHHKPAVKRQEKPVWEAEKVRAIIEAVPDRFACAFVTAALTGIRLGELVALQWKHIDLEKQCLRIEQSVWKGTIVPPKTEASIRTVPIGCGLTKMLKNHKADAHHNGPDDFVFCSEEGKPLNPDVLRKDVLYPALDRLNIPRQKRAGGFHAFRHSAATLINSQTGNLKLAQKFLGHAQISTTADIYTHSSEQAEREAALVLEKSIFGDLRPVSPEIQIGRNSETVQ